MPPEGTSGENYTHKNTVEGNLAATVEAHVGSMQKTRAANSVKGTVRTQVVFHPWGPANRSPVESSSGEKNGNESGELRKSGVRLLVATKGVYEVNPSTGTVTTQGELLGSLHWLAAEGCFRQDPWGLVSIRWRPSVSCEGGGPQVLRLLRLRRRAHHQQGSPGEYEETCAWIF